MEAAVIYRDLNVPEPVDEYPLLLPAVMFSPKVLYASDNAQYFEIKELLASLNAEKKAEYLRKVMRNVKQMPDEIDSGLGLLLEKIRALQKVKTAPQKLSILRMEYNQLLKYFESNYMNYVDSSLEILDMANIEELNRKTRPHFMELYKTYGNISKSEGDNNIIKAIGRVLTEPSVIPLLFEDIRQSEFCKPFNTVSDFRNNALYCSDESLFELPSLEKLSAVELGSFRHELLEKGCSLRNAVEKASVLLRDFRPDDEHENIVTAALDGIEDCMDEFKSTISKSHYTQYTLGHSVPDFIISVYLGVCPALKLLKLYTANRIISPEVELYLSERYISRLNPECRILLFAVDWLPLKKNEPKGK